MAKTDKKTYYEAVGRRRESSARVRLHVVKGKTAPTVYDTKQSPGDILVNKLPYTKYFPLEIDQKKILLPLELTKSTEKFVITIHVGGGGKQGQVGAIRHGLARALCLVDESYRGILKPVGLLTRDPRTRERRKAGTGGKARRQKQSPKR